MSFHETKNVQCGEGGALLINDERFIERAEILREKGTNRSQFFRGEVDKYTWIERGSSFLPSEFNAAVLYAQLQMVDEITEDRLKSWDIYYKRLEKYSRAARLELPEIPVNCEHNAHMFYIKCRNLHDRSAMIHYLKENEIHSVFHYVPLHSSPGGRIFGEFFNEDKYTTLESERLLRLPMFYGLQEYEIDKVCTAIKEFLDMSNT